MSPRYRFSGFVVSPARRVLLRAGREVEIIPRYFDLLLLLLERRHEAVHRREIHEAVWRDVVVSDGALSQAVRTLRRALGDDPREPVFIKTIQRHGYRFVWPDVVEEPDGAPEPATPSEAVAPAPVPSAGIEDPVDKAMTRLLSESGAAERREAAEQLHALGTEPALRALDRRPGHEAARALLRDARWDVPSAGPVPILGQPGWWITVLVLLRLRLLRAARVASLRWGAAAAGGAIAGLVAGAAGGAVLRAGPGSEAGSQLPLLGLIGALIGGLGAAGVGAGLAAAEAVARSARGVALVICGALGGGAVGAATHLLAFWVVRGVFGHELPAIGGGFEGLLLGGAAGLGYALSTPRPAGGGMAAPRGGRRLATAAVTGLCCAAAAVVVNQAGGSLGGVSLDFIARSFEGSQVGLAPVARLLGEEAPGPVTRMVLGLYEGFLFGFGLAIGLTRRPAPPET